MIISESGLKKAITQAWGKGGYHIMFDGEQMTLFTEDWFVQCDWDKFPRKVLAAVVEHMGYLPEEGNVLHIQKGEDVQTEIPETAGEDIHSWITKEGEAQEVSMVPMVYRGVQLYQQKDGSCFIVNPPSLQILEQGIAKSKTALIFGGTRMQWSHDGELLIIRTCRPAVAHSQWEDEEQQAVWKALEQVNLHDKH